jgi:hypothetical protein
MNVAQFSSAGLFADDIRSEEHGQFTLVGVMPDNVNIEFPESNVAILPRLAIFVRSSFDVAQKIQSDLVISFRSPAEVEISSLVSTAVELQEEVNRARDNGAPMMSMHSRMIMTPFPLLERGRYTVTASYDGETRLAGFLNVVEATPPS